MTRFKTTFRTIALVAVASFVALAACADATAPDGLSDEQFIEAMVALRQAARAAGPDEAGYAVAREQVLAAQSITADDLAAYLAAHNDDLEHLAEVWQEVATRLPDVETQ